MAQAQAAPQGAMPGQPSSDPGSQGLGGAPDANVAQADVMDGDEEF